MKKSEKDRYHESFSLLKSEYTYFLYNNESIHIISESTLVNPFRSALSVISSFCFCLGFLFVLLFFFLKNKVLV